MRNEMNFFNHCKKIEYNHDELLVYDVLDSDIYLCEKDYYFISKLQYKLINQKSPYS